MPTLHVHMTGKPTPATRRALVQRLTDAVCRSVDKRPDDVTIYLHTHGGSHETAFAGVLYSDKRSKQQQSRPRRIRGKTTRR